MKRAVTLLNMEFYFSEEQINRAMKLTATDNEQEALTWLLLTWFQIGGEAEDFARMIMALEEYDQNGQE